MARLDFPASLPCTTFLITVCASLLLTLQAPSLHAQTAPRPTPRPASPVVRTAPAPRPFVPSVPRAPIARSALPRPFSPQIPRPFVSAAPRPLPRPLAPHFASVSHLAATGGIFLFPHHPIFFPRHFFFGGPLLTGPFFQSAIGFGFTTWWMPTCSPYWSFGYYCTGLPPASSPFANYFTLPPPEPTVYSYTPQGEPLVWLYLKNGTAYSVTDYWFVNDQVHFLALQANGASSPEQTIAFDDLDVPKTTDVNTRRGFRVVKRNQPLAQYLHDQPNSVPPLLQPSSNP